MRWKPRLSVNRQPDSIKLFKASPPLILPVIYLQTFNAIFLNSNNIMKEKYTDRRVDKVKPKAWIRSS